TVRISVMTQPIRRPGAIARCTSAAFVARHWPPFRHPSASPLVSPAALRRQHFALADVVGLAHDAFFFHAFDDAGSAVVADLQVALDEAGGAFALARDQRDRLVVEIVARAAVA